MLVRVAACKYHLMVEDISRVGLEDTKEIILC